MKKQLLPIALLFGIASYAQVGIGTPLPNNSAQLEVVSTDKGVLIPRVALTSTTDIATITNGNVESLIVFNTNVAADVTQGYYYWFNNKWNRLLNQDEDSDDQTLDLVGTILSIEDGNSVDLGPAFTASETLTTFVDNGDGTLTYTDENGVATTINLTAAVQAVETTTNLTQDVATGEISYTNENGVVQNANVVSTDAGNVITAGSDGGAYLNTSATNTSEVTQAAGHSDTEVTGGTAQTIATHDPDGAGALPAVTINETVTTLVDNGDRSFTYTSEDGTVTTFTETLTSLVDNGDGTITYTDEDGNATTFDAKGTLVDNGDGTFTFTDAAGVATVIDIAANETVTTLVDNGDGSFTYTSEDGTVTTFTETLTSLFQWEPMMNKLTLA